MLDLNYEIGQEVEHYHNETAFPNQTLANLIIHNITHDAEVDIEHYIDQYLGMSYQ